MSMRGQFSARGFGRFGVRWLATAFKAAASRRTPKYPSPMNWLLKNFLRGLVIVVPIAVTVYLLFQAFVTLDRLLKLRYPGLGVAVLIAATIAIGALASNFIGRRLFGLAE